MLDYIGQRIKHAREMAGISQKKLGMTLGLSDKAISAYESGRTLPPLETLYKIAAELKKPLDYFISSEKSDESLLEKVDKLQGVLDEVNEELVLIKRYLENVASKQEHLVPPNEPVGGLIPKSE